MVSGKHSSYLLLVTLLTLGCKPKPAPSGLTHVVFQADWYPQPEIGGFYQAQLQGLYKAKGLDVEILPGGPAIVGGQMVGTGAAQFAMGTSDQVIIDNAHGVPEVAVAATMQQDPQAVMVHASSPIHNFSDLQGHTIAVKPGSIWFQYLVKRYNLTDVKEVPATYSVANFVQDPNYIQQAFVTSEPYFAEKAGSPVRTLLISSTEYQPTASSSRRSSSLRITRTWFRSLSKHRLKAGRTISPTRPWPMRRSED